MSRALHPRKLHGRRWARVRAGGSESLGGREELRVPGEGRSSEGTRGAGGGSSVVHIFNGCELLERM